MTRISTLDDFRAIAISLVVVMHGAGTFFSKPVELNFFQVFIFSGGTGVTLFFVLSGLLVTKPFIQAFKRNEVYSIREYIVQRVLRIVPLYYVWVAIAAFLTGTYSKVPEALFFSASGLDFEFYSAVWWSLCVEVQFYILVPLLFYIGGRFGRLYLGFSAALIVGFYTAWAVGGFSAWPSASFQINDSVIGKLPAFAAGILCGIFMPVIAENARRLFWLRFIVTSILACGLFFALEHRAADTSFFNEIKHPQWPLLESLTWGGLVLVLAPSGYSVLGKVGAFLSKISYSLYLSHVPVIIYIHLSGLASALGALGAFGLAIAVSLLISWFSFHLIEEPFLRLKDKLRKPDSSPSPVFPIAN